MIYHIQSRSNQRLKDLIKKKDQLYFFEGEKLVRDILNRGIAVAILIVNEKAKQNLLIPASGTVQETWIVTEPVMEKLSSLKEKPDFIAILEAQEKPVDFRQSPVVIGLDSIQDPANVGTIFRCAAAFGIETIALTGVGVNLNNSKFLRAAQHSFFDVNCQRFADLDTLIKEAEAANFNIYLTSSHDSTYAIAPHHIERPCLIIFGNEGQGIERTLFERFPSVKISQKNKIESLNVGVSACIIMYEISLAFGIVR